MQVPNEDEAPIESEDETPHVETTEEAIQFITSIGKLQIVYFNSPIYRSM